MPRAIKSITGTVVAFGDVVRLSSERSQDPDADGFDRYIGLEHLSPSDLKVRAWGNVVDGVTFTSVFRPGQVLFGKRRAYQRKVAVADFSGVCSGDIYVLEPKDHQLLPDLLPFICQSEPFYDYVISMSQGGLSPRVNWKALAKYEFALPSLEDQQRIVGVLQALELTLGALEACRRASVVARSSLANAYFLDHKWPTFPLGELLDYASDGPFGSKIKSEHYANAGVRVIRLQNIDANEWNDGDKAFVSAEYFESALKGYEVRAGDVVVAGLGDERIPAGRSCVVPSSATPALNKADCFCLRPIARVDSRFLSMFLSSSVGLQQSAQYSQGTTRVRLNLGNIKRMVVPVPPQVDQERFVASMLALLAAELNLRTRTRNVTALKATVLDHLFRVAGR